MEGRQCHRACGAGHVVGQQRRYAPHASPHPAPFPRLCCCATPRHWLRPNENCTLYAGAVPTHRPEDDVPLAALKGKPAAKKPAAKKKKKTAGPKKKIKKKDSKNSKVPHPRPLVRCAGYALLLTGWLAGCFD